MKTVWEPVDIIVLILVSVVGTVFMFEQITPLFKSVTLSDNTIKFMNHGIGAVLAIVSMYVGSKIGKKSKTNKEI